MITTTRFSFVAAIVALGLLSGCASRKGDELSTVNSNAVESEGLRVSIEVPKTVFRVGEAFPVKVHVTNMTGTSTIITADNAALVRLKLWRQTTIGWEEIAHYPQFALAIVTPWELGAGKTRTFTIHLKVESSWPTAEPLRLTGEVNSRPDAVPAVTIQVEHLAETK